MTQKQAKVDSPLPAVLPLDGASLALQRMRWFFLILLALWAFVAMMLPITLFWFTANPASLSLLVTISPPAYIFYRVACYLFPRSRAT